MGEGQGFPFANPYRLTVILDTWFVFNLIVYSALRSFSFVKLFIFTGLWRVFTGFWLGCAEFFLSDFGGLCRILSDRDALTARAYWAVLRLLWWLNARCPSVMGCVTDRSDRQAGWGGGTLISPDWLIEATNQQSIALVDAPVRPPVAAAAASVQSVAVKPAPTGGQWNPIPLASFLSPSPARSN